MPEILSIGELLDLGNSAATAGLIPYSALEYNGSGDISGISGSAIAGGVDSAVVSSIVSSYVSSKVDQSAFDDCCSAMSSVVSSKLDASASSLFQPSGDYYSASNPSGFITGVDLSDYAKESSLSSKLDASASSQFQPSGNYVYESSYSSFSGDVVNNISSMSSIVSGLTGDYLEKSASGMFAPSGNYALSSDVSSTVDVVANNSASWGQGGVEYSGVTPVVVDNAEHTIGVSSMPLDVDDTMTSYVSGGVNYFGVNESALSLSSYALSSDVSGVIDTVSNNSGSWGGGGIYGDYVEKSATEVTIGSANTATYRAFAQGVENSAYEDSFVQGIHNSAWADAFAQGGDNFAHGNSIAQGFSNSAMGRGFAQGEHNSAIADSVAQGYCNSALWTAVVFGTFNLRGNGHTGTGHSAAFAIGDGTANSARHDLMLVTKDGEITMYSSTADAVGYKLVSTLKSLSAWATANGWTGV